MNNIDHPPRLLLGTSDSMSAGRDGLRDIIEAHASAAQRGPLARLQDDYDDDNEERSVTVGDAIEGAAVTTSDSARQAAALVFNQPTHNKCPLSLHYSTHPLDAWRGSGAFNPLRVF